MSNYLQQLLNQAVVLDPQGITFLEHPEQYRKALLELISKAQQRIYLNMLYLEKDQAGTMLLEQLIAVKQQRPDLEIKIFVDFYRSRRSRIGDQDKITNCQWYLEQLTPYNQIYQQQGKPEIEVYGVQANTSELLGVYHIKGHVIDNFIFYTGASVNDIYFALTSYRQDRYQIIDSPELANHFCNFIINTFQQQHSWLLSKELPEFNNRTLKNNARKYRNQVLSKPLEMLPLADSIENNSNQDKLKATLIYGLGNKNNLLSKSIFALLKEAKEEVILFTPYFNPSLKLRKLFKELLQRNVKITLILGDKTANDFYVEPGTKVYNRAQALPYLYETNLRNYLKRYQQFLDSGLLEVRLWKDGKNSYHVKGVMVDQTYHLLTGHNLNPRGFRADAENAILIHDPQQQILKAAQQEFAYIYDKTFAVTQYQQIEKATNYPAKVKSTLNRYRILLLDRIVKLLL